jgi:tetratricopeptide (TPR) repeat protein
MEILEKNPGLKRAKELIDAGDLDGAWKTCEELLMEKPNHAASLILASFIAWKATRYVIGYEFGQRAVSQAPHDAVAHLNLGINAHDLWLYEEAEDSLRTAARIAPNREIQGMAYMNLAAHYLDFGEFRKAEEAARQALKCSPYSPKAKSNLGFAMLGQNKWDGWEFYSYCLGLTHREKMKFGEEPDWNGDKGKTVVLYGEQGLGDEISFASMIPDAARDCKKIIFSCDKKLKGLFTRSFPTVRVYGTRRAKPEDNVRWDQDDWQFDASCALGELGGLYRRSDEDFTGEPYLVPDPDRRLMWRALFDQKKKPVIGVAWTGGMSHTGKQFRTMDLEQLSSVMGSIDAHWISLQYKDASKEIEAFRNRHPNIDLVQYSFATLTDDYDDTAALVAECDLVISVQTAVVHLCGAIGKECWVLLPKTSQWRYGESGEGTIWYKAIRLFRQRSLKDWHGPLGEVTGNLRRKFSMKAAA